MQIYFDDWKKDDKSGGFSGMAEDFQLKPIEKSAIQKVLFANYTYENYSGQAFVLFVGVDGLLYEVSGSHCSCHGLEDQWTPEETSASAVRKRMESCSWEVSEDRRPDVEAALVRWENKFMPRRAAIQKMIRSPRPASVAGALLLRG
jgi:hypothetical protein